METVKRSTDSINKPTPSPNTCTTWLFSFPILELFKIRVSLCFWVLLRSGTVPQPPTFLGYFFCDIWLSGEEFTLLVLDDAVHSGLVWLVLWADSGWTFLAETLHHFFKTNTYFLNYLFLAAPGLRPAMVFSTGGKRGLLSSCGVWAYWVSLVAQLVKNPFAMQEIWVRSLGREALLEEGMATQSSILACRIPKDGGAWRATVHGVAESRTRLSKPGTAFPLQRLLLLWTSGSRTSGLQ